MKCNSKKFLDMQLHCTGKCELHNLSSAFFEKIVFCFGNKRGKIMVKTKLISYILSAVMIFSSVPATAAANGGRADTSSEISAYVDENRNVVMNNMTVRMGDNNLGNFNKSGGKPGWLFDVFSAKTDNYLYMDVNDSLTDGEDRGRIIEVSVDYFDAGTASFTLEYTNREEKVVEAPYKEFEGSLTWKTHTFVLRDAVLINGVNGADFRLCSKTKLMATSTDNFTVNRVSVKLTDKFNQLNIGMATEKYGNNFFTGEEIKLNYTIDNRVYMTESHRNGSYPLEAKFKITTLGGDTVFEKEDVIDISPAGTVKYSLIPDIGGKYNVYFITAVFENKEKGIYSEDTTRFSYNRTDYGKTMNYAFGTCAGRRPEWAPLMQNAGIGQVRAMQSYTNVTSSTAGADQAFYFPASGFTLQRRLMERNIQPFNTYLSVNTDLIPGEQAPYTEKGFEAFFDYANYVTDTEHHGVVSYDMWNEWDLMGASFNKHARPLGDYVEFMKKTYTEMKAQYPEIQFYGGVSSTVQIPWLRQILELGGGDYMDAYCVHAYKPKLDPMSGGAVEGVQQLRELLDEFGYEDMPIVTSELGWADDTYYGIDELKQGYYLAQYYVALKKIRKFDHYVMYIFQDGGQTKGNREHHWGLIEFAGAKTPGTAKASYTIISNLNHMLAGYDYKDDITVNDDTYVYRMASKGKEDDILFMWARGNGGAVTVDLGIDEAEMYDAYGNKSIIKGIDGKYSFALSEAPVYIKGNFKKFEKCESGMIEQNDFDIEFAQNASFKIKNPTGKKLNVEIKPQKNNDLKFDITENDDMSLDVYINTKRTSSYRDLADIKITDGENTYVDGVLVLEYKTPLDVDVRCEPSSDGNGGYDYGSVNFIIDISNNAKGTVSGDFIINSLDGVDNYKNLYENISIPSGGRETIKMNILSDTSQFRLVASFITDDGTAVDFNGSTSYAVCDYAYTKPVADGVISDGEYSKKIYLGSDDVVDIHAVDPYVGADDFSANLSYAWDEDNLYVAMECTDNKLFDESPSASAMWRYDSFQLAGVYDPEEKFDSSVLTSVLYGVTDGKKTLEMVKNNAVKAMTDEDSGFEGAIQRNENTTVYEVKIPWKTLLTEDREVLEDTVFKLAVLANDNDGAGRKAAVQYGEGIYSGGTSSEAFIKMYLSKKITN